MGTVRVGGDGASFLVGRFAGFAARRIVLVGAAGIPVGRRVLLRGRTGPRRRGYRRRRPVMAEAAHCESG